MPWPSPVRSLLVALALTAAPAAQDEAAAHAPSPIADYVPYFVRYAAHAETIWHACEVDGGDAGYWGDGKAVGNGGVRGTCNLTLAYAVLAHAAGRGWLDEEQRRALAAIGLDRAACLRRVQQSWRYLAAGHLCGGGACADGRQWGRSWQSSLWVGAAGLAALLVWDDLDEGTRAAIGHVVVDEADQKIGATPRDFRAGNTAAEENGWDTHAPAIALALFPQHPHAGDWLRAAQVLAANTLSTRADLDSDARLGSERVGDVITTQNLFADFTLDNHGFFHPSYLRVSGQELGEALLMLRLGDQRHGTHLCQALQPYAMHHVAESWQVLKKLLLPDGEFAYPSGSDWAIHLPSGHSYLAFIATALGDPTAELARRRAFTAAAMRRDASPPGRLLGATNFEWWWEPLVLKRFATALLQLDGAQVPAPAAGDALLGELTWWSPPTRVFVHRTERYLASVSLRGRPTGLVIPLGHDHLAHPFVTTPLVGGLMPRGAVHSEERFELARGAAIVTHYERGATAAMVALRDVVLFVADDRLGALGIQNDNVVTGQGRRLGGNSGPLVPPMSGQDAFEDLWGLCIDDQLGLNSPGGFDYRPAADYTRRSAAEDRVIANPVGGGTALLLCPRHDGAATVQLGLALDVEQQPNGIVVRLRDGVGGPMVEVTLATGRGPRLIAPRLSGTQSCRGSKEHPLAALADTDPSTFAVLTTGNGKGPGAEGPVVLAFAKPDAAASATALRIHARPRYGPHAVALYAMTARERVLVGQVTLADRVVELPLHAGARWYELVIESGYDRGEVTPTPRNTQIAELAFVLPAIPSDGPALTVEIEQER